LLGREIVRQSFVLESGTHSVNVSLPNGMYLLSLQTTDGKCVARLLSEGKGNKTTPSFLRKQESPTCLNHDFHKINEISKINLANPENLNKILVQNKGGEKANTDFQCQYGDTLILQCFITESELFVEEHIVPLTKNASLKFLYPHLEVWKCVFKDSISEKLDYPKFPLPEDFTITLTLDTLLKNYYVSFDPESFEFIPNWGLVFSNGMEGTYSIYEELILVGQYPYEEVLGEIMKFTEVSTFIRTMQLSDSMLLEWVHLTSGTKTYVRDYLFIKQN